MNIEAELFDGTVLEFPEGTSPEVIQNVVRQQTAQRRGSTPPAAAPAPAPTAAPAARPPEANIMAGRFITPAGEIVSGTPGQPAAKPDQTLTQYIMGTAAQGLRGAREGTAAVLGLPIDAVNNAPRLLNLLPGVDGVGPISKEPFMGSDFIDKQVLGLGGAVKEPPPPQDFIQRGARRVGKELGAAAVPAGGAIVAGARVGVQGARELPALARMFVEPAALNPTRYAAKEATIATGAGTGAAVANEIVDPNTTAGHVADFAGAVTGAGLTGLAGMILGGSKNIIDALRQNPQYADQVVKDAVTDRLLEAGGYRAAADGAPANADPLISAIMNPQRQTPSQLIPGYKETVADRTGNAGIAALEYSRQQGPGAGRFVEQRSANNEAVGRAMDNIAPTETPGMFREALAAERNRRLEDIVMNTQGAQAEAADAARKVAPTMPDATARGSSARTALQEAKDTVKEQVDTLYRPINEATVPVNVAPLAERFDAVTNSLPLNDQLRFLPTEARVPAKLVEPATPPAPSAILGPDGTPVMKPGTPATGEVPLREVAALNSGLSQDVRTAQNAGELQRGRVAGQFKDEVTTFIDEALPPQLREQYDAAKAARRDMADRFERPGTALNDILQRQEGGGYATDSSAVTPRLIPTDQGNITDFRSAMREAGKDPRLRNALADEIVVQAERSGAIKDPDALRQFLKDRNVVLEQFPELKSKLEVVASSTERANTAQTFQRGIERNLGTDATPGTGPVGKYLRYGDAQSVKAITEVLNAPDPGKAAAELVRFVGDNPRALEGARAAFWQKLRAEATSTDNTNRSMGGKDQWRGDWMKRWLDDPKTQAVAEKLYADKPEDMAALRAFADVLDNADLRTRGKAAATSGTSQGMSNILTPETLQSRGYAYMRGQISGTYLATSIAAVVARRAVRSARSDAIERMTDEVLLDPQKAVLLLKENNPANRAALARKAKGWFGNEASTIVNLANEDDDQVKSKAMEQR